MHMLDSINPIPKKELEARYWFLSHVTGVEKLGHVIFIVFDAMLILIVLVYAINLYGIHLLSYPRGLRSVAQPIIRISPTSYPVSAFNIVEIGGLSATAEKSDLYALVQNPNASYMARFRYSFFYNSASHGSFENFLYPGEQKYLIGLALAPLAGATSQIQITDLQWTKMTQQELENIKARTGLVTKDYKFEQPSLYIPFSRLTFILKNTTGYQFSNIALPVVLRYGGRVVALNSTIIDTITPADSRVVDLRWFTPVGHVDGYAITPTIDVFDQSTFLTPLGEQLPDSSGY